VANWIFNIYGSIQNHFLFCVFEWVVLWVGAWMPGWLGGWREDCFGFGIAHSVAHSAVGLVVWAVRGRCVHNFVLWFFSYETETELHMYMCVMASMLQQPAIWASKLLPLWFTRHRCCFCCCYCCGCCCCFSFFPLFFYFLFFCWHIYAAFFACLKTGKL